MWPILFYLSASNVVGETPFAPGIAVIEQEARLFPPKRSPWHGDAQTALKVTLWESPGAMRKMRVNATQNGSPARDTYWFENGKIAYGVQTRTGIERRLTFHDGKLHTAEVRQGFVFKPVAAREVERLDQDIAALVKTCLTAPGLRSRQATVKSVEANRVVFHSGAEIDAWVTRRPGDKVPANLVGKKVTYDFTAVEMDGQEVDYLNMIQPVSGAAVAAAKPSAKKKAVAAKRKARRKR